MEERLTNDRNLHESVGRKLGPLTKAIEQDLKRENSVRTW